ncbi:hypothetical protein CC78DRAFT_39599 [Lojkania enalia]|uniref:Uncharacterized protein n=1 Tax=Lojkania enalia TaxID=147567 RepID=A0A9P4N2U8_9PLEO|nr:hypothetical protein CC78DRAFT_39599 [Didymosphaeria enalia]
MQSIISSSRRPLPPIPPYALSSPLLSSSSLPPLTLQYSTPSFPRIHPYIHLSFNLAPVLSVIIFHAFLSSPNHPYYALSHTHPRTHC